MAEELLIGSNTPGEFTKAAEDTNKAIQAWRFEALHTGTIKTMALWLNNLAQQNAELILGVYEEEAEGPKPNKTKVLGEATLKEPGKKEAWNEVTGLAIPITKGVHYWLAMLPLGPSAVERIHFNDHGTPGGTLYWKSTNANNTSLSTVTTFTEKAEIGGLPLRAMGTVEEVKVTVLPLAALQPTATLNRVSTLQLHAIIQAASRIERVVRHGLTALLEPPGQVSRTISHRLAGALLPTGLVNRAISHSLAGTLAPMGVVNRIISHSLSGTLTPTGFANRVMRQKLAALLSASAAITRGFTRHLEAILSASGVLNLEGYQVFGASIGSLIERTQDDLVMITVPPSYIRLFDNGEPENIVMVNELANYTQAEWEGLNSYERLILSPKGKNL